MNLRNFAIAGAAFILLLGAPGMADAASTNLYLLDDGIPNASMSMNRPSGGSGGSRELPPSSLGETDPAKFQEWSYDLSNMTASINEFTIWAAPADPSGEGSIAISVDILDCGSGCTRLAGGAKSLAGVSSPTKVTIPLTIKGHEFGDGHDLSVKVTVPSTSTRDVTIYYGSKNRHSNLHLSALDATPPPTTTTTAPTTTIAPTTTVVTTTTTSVAEESTEDALAAAPSTTTTMPPPPQPELQETDIQILGPEVVQMVDPVAAGGPTERKLHFLDPQEGMLVVFATAVEAFRLYWQVALALGTLMATLLIVGFSRLELPEPAKNPFERIRSARR